MGFKVEDEYFVVLDLEDHSLLEVQDGAGINNAIESVFEDEMAVLVVVIDGVFGR